LKCCGELRTADEAAKEREPLVESRRVSGATGLKALLARSESFHDNFCALIRDVPQHPLIVFSIPQFAGAHFQRRPSYFTGSL